MESKDEKGEVKPEVAAVAPTPTPTPSNPVEEEGKFSKILSSIGIQETRSRVLVSLVLIVVVVATWVSFLLMAPFGFPNGKMITVKKGASLSEVSGILDKEGLIRSPYFFELCAKLVGGTKPVAAGQYLFKEPISGCAVAFRIANSISGIPAIRVTVPEGMSNKDVTAVLAKAIPNFDAAFFTEHARAQEGFLFPDTYFFPENVTALIAETTMTNNFNTKIEPWNGAIEASGHSLKDIVTMASILEREATTDEDKAIVSGILWNRISKGMALQVDAPFMYLLGKTSSQLTSADLQMTSAYNTYRNKGLPPGPIGNPGIAAIRAAIEPTKSNYLYYLSDNNGVMHYSKTYDEHITNKAKYLR